VPIYPYQSFDAPVKPPPSENMGAVCFTVDMKWLPYILGSLRVLEAPQTWLTEQDRATGEASILIGTLIDAMGCGVIDDIRLVGCELEKLVDGTWVNVADISTCPPNVRPGTQGGIQWNDGSGWQDLGNSSDPRTDGPATPPFPTPPTGQTGNCLAATNIIDNFRAMMINVANSIVVTAAATTALVALESFLDLALPLIGEIVQIATEMAAAFLDATAEVMESAFTGDLADTIYHDFKCSIDCSIGSDGSVTTAQIATIKSNFAAKLPHGLNPAQHAVWLLAVNDWLDTRGPQGLMILGKSAGIMTGDCADCDCGWCEVLDFSLSEYGFATLSGFGSDYLPGNGWGLSTSSGGVYVTRIIASGVNINYAKLEWTFDGVAGGGTSGVAIWMGYNSTGNLCNSLDPLPSPSGSLECHPNGDYGGVVIGANNNNNFTQSPSSLVLKRLTLSGTGVGPGIGVAC